MEIEQEILNKQEHSMFRTIQRGESHEEFLNRQLIAAGRREAILSIWKERDIAMKVIEKKEQAEETAKENL